MQALDVDALVVFGMKLVGGHASVQVEVGVREVAYLIAGQSPGDQDLGLATLLDSPENVRTSVEMACRHDEKDGDEDEGRARDGESEPGEAVLGGVELPAKFLNRLRAVLRIIGCRAKNEVVEGSSCGVAADPVERGTQGIDVGTNVEPELLPDFGRHQDPGPDTVRRFVSICEGACAAEVEQDDASVDESQILRFDVAVKVVACVELAEGTRRPVHDSADVARGQFSGNGVHELHDEEGASAPTASAIQGRHEARDDLSLDNADFVCEGPVVSAPERTLEELQRSDALCAVSFAHLEDNARAAVSQKTDDPPVADDISHTRQLRRALISHRDFSPSPPAQPTRQPAN